MQIMLARTSLFALVLLLIVLGSIGRVHGNGVHVGSQEVFSGSLGPYGLQVAAIPKVGALHLTILISPVGSEDLVKDANISASAVGPGDKSQSIGPVFTIKPALMSANVYALDIPIPEVGVWTLTLTVDSHLGQETVDFPVEVKESGGVSLSVIAFGAAFSVLVVWTLFVRWRHRIRLT